MENYAGDWAFKAHFPRNCKPQMDCRIETLTFERKTSGKDGWEAWRTFGNKVGNGCSLKE